MLSPASQRALVYTSLVIGFVGIGVVITSRLFDVRSRPVEAPAQAPRPAPASATQTTPSPDALRVLSVEGKVDRVREPNTESNPLVSGDLIFQQEGVRTNEHSSVRLGIGGQSTIELKELGELLVLPDELSVQRLKLLGGRVDVDYKEQGRQIRIESRDGDAVAATDKGVFTVLQSGDTVAVATRTGTVDLFAGESKVAVTTGMQSVVSNGAASAPEPIPVDLLLRVVDPGCLVQREFFIVLSGWTAPGARVMAGGEHATVKPDGRFFVRVPLKLGRNEIEVVSDDVSGHRKTRSFSCVTVDPGAPIEGINIKWGPTGKARSSP